MTEWGEGVVLEKQGTPSFLPTPLSTRAASIRGLDVESIIACLSDSVFGLCVSMGERHGVDASELLLLRVPDFFLAFLQQSQDPDLLKEQRAAGIVLVTSAENKGK